MMPKDLGTQCPRRMHYEWPLGKKTVHPLHGNITGAHIEYTDKTIDLADLTGSGCDGVNAPLEEAGFTPGPPDYQSEKYAKHHCVNPSMSNPILPGPFNTTLEVFLANTSEPKRTSGSEVGRIH
jgi:hypothetical protein